MGKVLTDATGKRMADALETYNNFLSALHGNLNNLKTADKSSVIAAINEVRATAIDNKVKREPNLAIDSNDSLGLNIGASRVINCTYRGNGTLSAVSSDESLVSAEVNGGTVTITRLAQGEGNITVTINLSATDEYYGDSVTVTVLYSVRYGIRIKKAESDPEKRVEYLFDAVGRTPAHMDFSTGSFDYGDWGGEWFVTDNKPLMLKSDGAPDYYLNPNNYAQKADGTASDVANTSYDGNAMAQIPLIWIKRYEDSEYEYEIVSNVQYDEDYKAYAHTRADGTIADYFYWSLFGASGNATKMRSLSGQTRAALNAQNHIDGAKGNGAKWYIHTWSQRECIRTLLILMGKSTDTQAVFGTGNCRSGSEGSVLATGTLKDKGQFFGYSANNQQVKVFHIEAFWGDQWDWTAGLINNGSVYVKMTPEGVGYRVTDTTGYTNTGITIAGSSSGYISACSCSEYGIIPKTVSGSGTTYYADGGWFNNSSLCFLLAGGSAINAAAFGGAFASSLHTAPSASHWAHGGGLSCEMPAA